MKLINPLSMKYLSEAAVGELLLLPSFGDNSEMVVKLEPSSEYDGCLLAVLNDGDTGREPYFMTYRQNVECASYGSEWVFEIDQISQNWLTATNRNTPGIVHITESNCIIRLDSDDRGRALGKFVDLSTFILTTTTGEAVYTADWRIWASEEERNRIGAKPLLVHKYEAETAK